MISRRKCTISVGSSISNLLAAVRTYLSLCSRSLQIFVADESDPTYSLASEFNLAKGSANTKPQSQQGRSNLVSIAGPFRIADSKF